MKFKILTILLALFAFAACSTTDVDPEEPDNTTVTPGGDETPGGDDTPGGGDDNPGGGDTPGGGDDNPGGGDDNPGGDDTPSATVIYYEDFDGNTSFSSSYVWVSNDKSFAHATGEGAANVGYNGYNAQFRKDNYGSTGNTGTYDGASGACYIRLYYKADRQEFGYLTVGGISTCGYSNFALSFGAAQGSDVMSLEISHDGGSTWTNVPYTFTGSYNSWSKASATFSVAQGVTGITLRMTIVSTTVSYGANFDDFRIEVSDTPGSIVIGGSAPEGPKGAFAELPLKDESQTDWVYGTLFTKSVTSNVRVRNYSFCYDTRRHNPIWVAFPMHDIYKEGRGARTSPDPWQKYPDLPLDKQSIIWDEGGNGYQYWSYAASQSQNASWTKGHLCMSASRGGADTEMNIQTFYPVNISPQIGKWKPRFGSVWSKTENFHYHYGTQICSDTLYIVAGCWYGDPTWIEYDACNYNTHSDLSKQCEMPTHHFKVLLRTRDGNTGKKVQNCGASELKAIGFWFDTILPDEASDDLADYAKSVAEIEQLTGYTFFPDVDAGVKQSYTLSEWGL